LLGGICGKKGGGGEIHWGTMGKGAEGLSAGQVGGGAGSGEEGALPFISCGSAWVGREWGGDLEF